MSRVHSGSRLERAGVAVSRLGFGGAPLGNLYAPVEDVEARSAVEAAVAAGIGYFDTAPLYGFGMSEDRLGAALESCVGADAAVISTKVGRRLRRRGESRLPAHDLFAGAPDLEPYFDWSRDGARASFEESLARLRRSHADIIFVHDPAREDFGIVERETFPALEQLRADGAILALGAAVNVAADAVELLERMDLDCVLIAGRVSLLDQSALPELVPLCDERGIGLIIGGVFNSGVLADSSPDARFDYAPVDPPTRERVERLRLICRAHGVELASAALQYPFRFPPVVSVIPGMRSAAEVAANLENLSQPIPRELWDELDREMLRTA